MITHRLARIKRFNQCILQTSVRAGLFWLLMFILISFTVRPLPAASPSSELDLARMDAFVREQVQRHGIPGLALAVVDGNRIVHLGGYGKADQNGRSVTPQTPFLWASVSKPLTALAIMQLVEAGQVALDAPVQHYVPDFAMADPVAAKAITVRHLLLHTSGIPTTACDTRIDAETLAQYVAELKTVDLSAPVGARHDYCSGNYNVLGRIIETVSGQSFGRYMQQQIFAPLQMHHSFVSEQEALQDGMAQGYQWLFGLLVPMHHRYNPSQLPSGYLIASAEDMAHFLVAQLNGGRYGSTALLSPEGIAAMQAPGVSRGEDSGAYGLGWVIGSLGGVPAVFHYGDNFDYHALLFMEPETRRGAVLLMNANNALAIFTAFKELEEGIVKLLGEQQPAPTALSFRMLYLMVDLPLVLLMALALWPLVRMRHWVQVQQKRHYAGRLRPVRIGLQLVWTMGLPLTLLIGARLALHRMGAQSWFEGLSAFPDIILWIWAICLLMLLTGVIRLGLFLRLLRHNRVKPEPASATGPALRHSA